MKFTDFHSNGAVCSPTRAALMTGKYQQRVGIEGVVTAKSHRTVGLDLAETTFADAMKQEGYATGMMGKWHLGYPASFNPVLQGFDRFQGFVSGNVDYHSHIDQENYKDWWQQDKLAPEEGYATDLITKHSIDFIKAHQEESFLLYIAHGAPHSPNQGRLSPPVRGAMAQAEKQSEEETATIYKEMIEVMDEGIGAVISTLKDLDLDQNTLVFFFSDNGPSNRGSSGGLHGAKGSVWEGGHRVPAIAWWPGKIKPAQQTGETAMTMDVFPTIMAISGAKEKLDWDGIDISQVLLNNTTLPQRKLFWRHFNNAGTKQASAVRSGDWKLVRLDAEAIPQLYNLRQDLAEQNNLATSNPDIFLELSKNLEEWETEVSSGVKRVSP
jgi:arylsulfatase A-like enzyme